MRKPQIQPALASLTPAEREQLADWLRHDDYEDVLVRVNQPRPDGFGPNISKSPLQTFYAKVALFDVINAQLAPDKKLSLATFESLGQRHIHFFLSASGDEEKLAAAHQAILNTTVELAGTATTATQLLALQRLADFPARSALRDQMAELREQSAALRAAKEERDQAKAERAQQMHEHKIALDLRQEARAERNTALREAHLKLAEQKLAASNSKLKIKNSTLGPDGRPGDHLGPIATNWKEVGQRVCKLFGITPEEEARRAELHKTWVDPNIRPGIPEEINPVLDDNDWSDYPFSQSTNSPASSDAEVADVARASTPCAAPAHKSSTAPSSATVARASSPAGSGTVSVPGHTEANNTDSASNTAHPHSIKPSLQNPVDLVNPVQNSETQNPASLSEIHNSKFSIHNSTTPPTPPPSASNPPKPIEPSNNPNLNPAQLAHFQRMDEFYKGVAAHARELHAEFMARRAQLNQENQTENENESENQNETPKP
jgi:hypothetical protein